MNNKYENKYTFAVACGLLLAMTSACTDDVATLDEDGMKTGTEAGDGDGDGDGDTSDGEEGFCGDEVVQPGEECDQGGDNGPGQTCTSACMLNVCGDGEIGPGEGCDDGNDVDDDGCSNACVPGSCGDGLVDDGEVCDDGNDVDTDACLSTCAAASCGDGFVFAEQEECDDGNPVDTDACLSTCAPAYCGDGFVFAEQEVCDDDNDNDFDDCTTQCTVPEPAVLELTISPIKQFEFSWAPVFGAEYYQLLESADVGEDFVQVGGDIVGESTAITVPLHFRLNASYKLLACDADGCGESAVVDVVGSLAQAVGYFKASNTGAADYLGYGVALSGDGNTLAVGARDEDSSAMGIDGDPNNNSATDAGAVYVFVRSGNAWSQQAYVKASNTGAGDYFGHSVALSEDGNTLAVGANFEDSSAMGIGGDQNNNSASNAGAVYVFARSGNAWSQQAYIKASNTGVVDYFGTHVALSGDGNTLAVDAELEDSSATGIGGDQNNDSAAFAGAVYVFARSGNAWSQQAYVKASNTNADDRFGSVALSGDGNTLAVGAYFEDSDAVGIGGNQNNNSASNAGAVYVFARSGNAWSQQAYVKASNTGAGDSFGWSVALSGDGNTLAVGAYTEDSSATGIDGNQADNSASNAGAVYVFARSGNAWSQQAYVKASNTGAEDYFGYSVALSGDGNTLAVGACDEDSSAMGIGGDPNDNSASSAGAVHVFARSGNAWSQRAYVKASNTGASDVFGRSVALSGDGNTLAVGAVQEGSSATGIGGNQADNSAANAGAVYLY